MTNLPKHRVIFFELDANGSYVWDQDDTAVVERIVEVETLDEGLQMHREAVIAAGSISRANLSPAVERISSLPDYLRALNTSARLLEEMPEDNTIICALTEDIDYWAEFGVKTPADLASYLDGCFEREKQKAALD